MESVYDPQQDLKWLEKLTFCKLYFVLKATRPIHLPSYKGSTFRGAFGNQFQRIVCIKSDRKCGSCLVWNSCSYYNIFETPNLVSWHHSPYAPHPYVLEPPPESDKLEYAADEEIRFHIVLVGKAIDLLPYVVLVFWEMGKQGGLGKNRRQGFGLFDLIQVEDALDHGKLIFDGASGVLVATPSIHHVDITLSHSPTSTPTISFLTPTRIVYRNDVLFKDGRMDEILPLLYMNLYHRMYLLTASHCGVSLPKPKIPIFPRVSSPLTDFDWYEWKRFSSRKNRFMKLGGFVGVLEIPDDYLPWWPLLKAGEILHLGHATSFGLGKYAILQPSNSDSHSPACA